MSWSTCSPDIIYLILKSVDDKSLLICLTICRLWRDVAYHIIQTKNMWQKLVEDNLFNKAQSIKQKSTLSWREICFNYLLWINLNTIRVQFDKSWDLRRHNVKAIHVYKDKVVVVYDSTVEYFEAETSLRVVKKQNLTDCQETEHITVVCFNGNQLNVSFKHNSTEYKYNYHTYKLIDDRCFILDIKDVLWRHKCCGRGHGARFVMRNYGSFGSIIGMNADDKDVYALASNGNILKVKERSLQYSPIAQLNRPNFHKSSVIMMFLKHSVVYRVPCEDGSETKTVSRIGDTDEVVIECPGLTCVMPHGEILLLGYEDGTVEVCHARNLLSGNKNNLKFNIMDHVKNPYENVSIVALDVYEANGAPYLFIATKSRIYKMVLYQLSY